METIISRFKLDESNIKQSWEKFYLNKPAFNTQISTTNLIDATRIYNHSGIKVFVVYGTLLGVVRNKALIEWDTDVDLGFFDSDIDSLILAHPSMEENGFTLMRNDEYNSLITYERNGQYIDFYRFDKKSEKPFHHRSALYFPPKSITPLIIEPFGDGHVFKPNNFQHILNKIYGKKWRIEIKNSHFPANKIGLKVLGVFIHMLPSNLYVSIKNLAKFLYQRNLR